MPRCDRAAPPAASPSAASAFRLAAIRRGGLVIRWWRRSANDARRKTGVVPRSPAGRAAADAKPEGYDGSVTDPVRHPFDDEIEEMLSADPEFAARVRRTVELYRRGELNLIEHATCSKGSAASGFPRMRDQLPVRRLPQLRGVEASLD